MERNRTSLPVVNDFVALYEILEKISIKLRLSELYSKKQFDKVMPILSRVVGFLQAYTKMVQKITK